MLSLASYPDFVVSYLKLRTRKGLCAGRVDRIAAQPAKGRVSNISHAGLEPAFSGLVSWTSGLNLRRNDKIRIVGDSRKWWLVTGLRTKDLETGKFK